MQRRYSLKKNCQFSYVFRRGKSQANRHMVLLHVPGKRLLVGYSVSKKLGGAVVRNHIKRLLRECVRPNLAQMKSGCYVLIARQGAVGASLTSLRASFESAMRKGGYFKSEPHA